jgi:NADP-dependent aldehyde dehydrogenase
LFGPFSLLITVKDMAELLSLLEPLDGQLTASVHGTPSELSGAGELMTLLTRKAGRLVCNGFPTGVEVSPAMNHGGPYPSTGHPDFTAVGIPASLLRFAMLQCYDNVRPNRLPEALKAQLAGLKQRLS